MALTKKITSFIIVALIFVLSSLSVSSCFGKIYATQVTVTNEGIRQEADGTRHIVFYPDADGNRVFRIEYQITPENATEKDVTFIYNKQNGYASVSKDGVVTFDKTVDRPLSITVGVSVKTENSSVTDYILITSWHEQK